MKRKLTKICAPLMAVCMLFSSQAAICDLPAYAASDRYEAESAAITGDYNKSYNQSASGSYCVSLNNSFTWTQNISVSQAGYYDLNFYSYGVGGDKQNNVSVNGSQMGVLESKGGSAFKESSVTYVYLNAGTNKIQITKSWGYICLDYMTCTQSVFDDSVYEVSKTLINENASDSTKRLMSFLADNYGSKVITGQYCDDTSNGGLNGVEFNKIKSVTGETPAVMGLDFMRYTPTRTEKGDSTNSTQYALDFAEEGGIVSICWHWSLRDEYLKAGTDENGNPTWWGGFYTKNVDSSKFDFSTVMNNENSTAYKQLMTDIDAIAAQLQILEDNDVPVLFRPLHEASGGWFWWGSDGAAPYIKLWKTMYDKLTNEYGLDNLIWVWNGQDAGWYPGDDYVDIIGEDIYPGKRVYTPQSSKFNEAAAYPESKNKIVAMTENGCLFDLDAAKESHTMWSFFSVWNGDFCISSGEDYNEKSMWQKVYSSPLAINLDDLPDLKTYPIDDTYSDITLSENTKNLPYGDSFTLTPDVADSVADKNISWTSSSDCVTVNNGLCTAKSLGTATITASLSNGNSAVCTVTVKAKSVSGLDITVEGGQVYTGSPKTPAVTITDNTVTLVENKDYSLVYSDNYTAGTATVTITGIGNYTGSVAKAFVISPSDVTDENDIANAVISNILPQTYLGIEVTPLVSVRLNGKTILKNRDYSIRYSNNVEIGTASLTISGKGKYKGSVTKTFTIDARKSSTLTKPMIIARQSNPYAAVVSWVPDFKTVGYELMYADNESFKNSKTTVVEGYGKFQATVNNTKYDSANGYDNKKTLYVKVRSYAIIAGKKVYSSWSDTRFISPYIK